MFLKSYPSYGIDLNKITFKLEHKAIKLKDQIDQIGTVQIYSESLALLFLRDLKAMSRHIIALSNGEDETTFQKVKMVWFIYEHCSKRD